MNSTLIPGSIGVCPAKKVYHVSPHQIASSYPVVLLCGSILFLPLSRALFDLPFSAHRVCLMIRRKDRKEVVESLSVAQQALSCLNKI